MRQIFRSAARIRKVFSRLAFEGLVEIEPNRGASRGAAFAREAREIFAARRSVETRSCAWWRTFDAGQKAPLARHRQGNHRRGAPRCSRNDAPVGRVSSALAEMAGNVARC